MVMFSRDATGAPGIPGPSRMLWTRGLWERPSHTSGPHRLTGLHPAGPVPCSSYTEDAFLWDAVHRGTEQLGLLFSHSLFTSIREEAALSLLAEATASKSGVVLQVLVRSKLPWSESGARQHAWNTLVGPCTVPQSWVASLRART